MIGVTSWTVAVMSGNVELKFVLTRVENNVCLDTVTDVSGCHDLSTDEHKMWKNAALFKSVSKNQKMF